LATASLGSEDKSGDFLGTAEYVVGEFTSRFVCYRARFRNVPAVLLLMARISCATTFRRQIGVLALNLA